MIALIDKVSKLYEEELSIPEVWNKCVELKIHNLIELSAEEEVKLKELESLAHVIDQYDKRKAKLALHLYHKNMNSTSCVYDVNGVEIPNSKLLGKDFLTLYYTKQHDDYVSLKLSTVCYWGDEPDVEYKIPDQFLDNFIDALIARRDLVRSRESSK